MHSGTCDIQTTAKKTTTQVLLVELFPSTITAHENNVTSRDTSEN